MKKEKLLHAIGKIDDDMIYNAVHDTKAKKKHTLVKWGAVAACLCLVVCALTITHLTDRFHGTDAGDLVPMVYIDTTLYQLVDNQPNLTDSENEFVYLGIFESRVDSSKEPEENFQANDDIIGAKVYKYRNDVVVEIDNSYWLYENTANR